jgi:NADPH:quinone reductase-like Zn-dependent oxidoreductase
MKAVVQERYGSPDTLALREIAVPDVPDDGVLVRVRASSVNAVDWHEMTGSPVLVRISEGWRAPKQLVKGTDVAGVVEAVGKDVTELRPGDEVFGTRAGAFAEYVLGRVRNFVPKPANLSFEEAAAVPVAALTALQAVRDHARVTAGQRVLVNGAGGGVGTFTLQIAKAYGGEVTATSRPENLELLRSLGADAVVDHTAADVMAGPDRYDAILDLGGLGTLALRRKLTPAGVAVLIGSPDKSIPGIVVGMAMALVVSRSGRRRIVSFLAKPSRDDFTALKGLAEAGKLRAVVDRTYPLAETPDAMRYFGTGRVSGKIAIIV